MKAEVFIGMVAAAVAACGETSAEAYARLSACRGIWETNAYAYIKSIRLADDSAAVDANGRWFIDFVELPDVAETNRIAEVLRAKADGMLWYSGCDGIAYSTNTWLAVADYISRLKNASDPRWIDESGCEEEDVLDGGICIATNANPLLDFALYKAENYESFRQRHTNISEIASLNLFAREWCDMIEARQRREREVKLAIERALSLINIFWRMGARTFSVEAKSNFRSNIVERARLTEAEEHTVFGD